MEQDEAVMTLCLAESHPGDSGAICSYLNTYFSNSPHKVNYKTQTLPYI